MIYVTGVHWTPEQLWFAGAAGCCTFSAVTLLHLAARIPSERAVLWVELQRRIEVRRQRLDRVAAIDDYCTTHGRERQG